MNDSHPRPRRSASVVLLDAMLGLVTAVQTGNLPGRAKPGARRVGLIWLLAGVLVVAGGTAVLIGALMRAPGGLTDLPPGDRAALAPPPSSPAVSSLAAPAATTRSRASAGVTPSTSGAASAVSSTATAAPPVAPATSAGSHLTAAYAAANGSGLLGYRATVTLAAQGPAASTDWRLTVTLPRATLQIAAVDGATVAHDGAVWTFTPTEETRRIAAGASAVVTFEVRGATLVDAQPTDCRVGDETCAGLPG
jgi:hypothetical protein